eukprot:403356130
MTFNITKVENSTTGEMQQLNQWIQIGFKKSAAQIVYDLTYVQDFYASVTEQVVYTQSIFCDDSYNSNDPTCGWQYDKNGNKIQYSQGFCCDCPLSDIFTIADKETRGFSCILANTFYATAHCLKFSSERFSAYKISPPRVEYTITAQIQIFDKNYNFYRQYDINLRPDRREKVIDDSIYISIIGDFMPTQFPVYYNNEILLVPSKDYGYNFYSTFDNCEYCLLVDREMITMTGLECDKIGTSYYAFQTAGDKCDQPVYTCLKLQIQDLIIDDFKRIQDKKTPNYLLNHVGSKTGLKFVQETGQLAASCPYVQSTQLKFEVNTDRMSFIRAVVKMSISQVKLLNNGFEGYTNFGLIMINIRNDEDLAGEGQLSISNCSDFVTFFGNSVQVISVPAYSERSYNFTVGSNSNLPIENNTCSIQLTNSIGSILEDRSVQFQTTATNYQTVVEVAQGILSQQKEAEYLLSKEYLCGKCDLEDFFFALFCYFYEVCTDQILRIIFVYILMPFLFAVLIFTCLPCKLIKWLFLKIKCCKKKKQEKDIENSIDKQADISAFKQEIQKLKRDRYYMKYQLEKDRTKNLQSQIQMDSILQKSQDITLNSINISSSSKEDFHQKRLEKSNFTNDSFSRILNSTSIENSHVSNLNQVESKSANNLISRHKYIEENQNSDIKQLGHKEQLNLQNINEQIGINLQMTSNQENPEAIINFGQTETRKPMPTIQEKKFASFQCIIEQEGWRESQRPNKSVINLPDWI